MPNTTTLFITEIYASIQGESTFAGLPTVLIRTAGCNLRCAWCDSPHSFGKGAALTLDAIIEKTLALGHRHVCITGGEPLLQTAIRPLMNRLCDLGLIVSLETSGSLSTEGIDPRVAVILDVKCPGSGMSHKNLWENLERLRERDEIKFVLKDEQDYVYAKEISRQYGLFDKGRTILLSPVYDSLSPKTLVEWILRDRIEARLNLQVHKTIWGGNVQGV